MSSSMDVHSLIDEVHKRPALWDVQHEDYKARHRVPRMWEEVAQRAGGDVLQCKRKWKNLRDAYRAEVKRLERRIEEQKLIGAYGPNTKYSSKWIYFPSLTFLSESKQISTFSNDNESTNSNSNDDNNHYNGTYNDNACDENFDRGSNIKLEPTHDTDDDDTGNDILFEEFQSIATPQAARRLSASLSMKNNFNNNNSQQNTIPNPPTQNTQSCECSKRANEQIHFLEHLGRQEKQLMKSTRQDISRYNKLDHIGDPDYNFLVSFLPQMKKMSELQNLKFRAGICEIVLNILAPPIVEDSPNCSINQQSLTQNASMESINLVNSTSNNNSKDHP